MRISPYMTMKVHINATRRTQSKLDGQSKSNCLQMITVWSIAESHQRSMQRAHQATRKIQEEGLDGTRRHPLPRYRAHHSDRNQADRLKFACSPVFFADAYCPMCNANHRWFARDAWVEEQPPNGRRGGLTQASRVLRDNRGGRASGRCIASSNNATDRKVETMSETHAAQARTSKAARAARERRGRHGGGRHCGPNFPRR